MLSSSSLLSRRQECNMKLTADMFESPSPPRFQATGKHARAYIVVTMITSDAKGGLALFTQGSARSHECPACCILC